MIIRRRRYLLWLGEAGDQSVNVSSNTVQSRNYLLRTVNTYSAHYIVHSVNTATPYNKLN